RMFKMGTYYDGPDADNVLFYDTAKAVLFGNYSIATELRSISGNVLGIPHFQGDRSPDTMRVFVCNLKAGNTQADRDQRTREALVLKNHLDSLVLHARAIGSADTVFVLAGNLNVYSSEEPAFQLLQSVGESEGAALLDPIDRPGAWHGDSAFAILHTNSARVRQFEGGMGGGLNDRFDFILA